MNIEQVLELFYNKINRELFQERLPIVSFIIYSTIKNKDGWGFDIRDGKYYIRVCAYFLLESTEKIYKNLLHQMIHFYNDLNGLKDTSRGKQYHNVHFHEAAEKIGLITSFDKEQGYVVEEIEHQVYDKIVNDNARDLLLQALDQEMNRLPKKQEYKCPICKRTADASLRAKLVCGYCMVEMIPKNVKLSDYEKQKNPFKLINQANKS